jgi:hypothetical protein
LASFTPGRVQDSEWRGSGAMTRQEWDKLWWDEFLAIRREDPTKDLTLLHKAVTTYMNKRYGARPAGEEKSGPPWWMQLGAIAIGVPMGFLGKFWDYMNGKKMLVGAIITALSVVATQLGVLLPMFGLDAVLAAKVVGVVTIAVGVLHKIYKFLYKEDHA